MATAAATTRPRPGAAAARPPRSFPRRATASTTTTRARGDAAAEAAAATTGERVGRLHARRLPTDASAADLRKLFAPHCAVIAVVLKKNGAYAFVNTASAADAARARAGAQRRALVGDVGSCSRTPCAATAAGAAAEDGVGIKKPKARRRGDHETPPNSAGTAAKASAAPKRGSGDSPRRRERAARVVIPRCARPAQRRRSAALPTRPFA